MNDLIKRSYLIKKFEYTGQPALSEIGKGYDLGIAAALRVVKNAPAAVRWIPVEVALPKPYERVLTADGIDGYVTENYLCHKTDGIEWEKGFQITHWMPKPEPPEREEDINAE